MFICVRKPITFQKALGLFVYLINMRSKILTYNIAKRLNFPFLCSTKCWPLALIIENGGGVCVCVCVCESVCSELSALQCVF